MSEKFIPSYVTCSADPRTRTTTELLHERIEALEKAFEALCEQYNGHVADKMPHLLPDFADMVPEKIAEFKPWLEEERNGG